MWVWSVEETQYLGEFVCDVTNLCGIFITRSWIFSGIVRFSSRPANPGWWNTSRILHPDLLSLEPNKQTPIFDGVSLWTLCQHHLLPMVMRSLASFQAFIISSHWNFYSRRSAAGSARTKVTRCHKHKWVCLIVVVVVVVVVVAVLVVVVVVVVVVLVVVLVVVDVVVTPGQVFYATIIQKPCI